MPHRSLRTCPVVEPSHEVRQYLQDAVGRQRRRRLPPNLPAVGLFIVFILGAIFWSVPTAGGWHILG